MSRNKSTYTSFYSIAWSLISKLHGHTFQFNCTLKCKSWFTVFLFVISIIVVFTGFYFVCFYKSYQTYPKEFCWLWDDHSLCKKSTLFSICVIGSQYATTLYCFITIWYLTCIKIAVYFQTCFLVNSCILSCHFSVTLNGGYLFGAIILFQYKFFGWLIQVLISPPDWNS